MQEYRRKYAGAQLHQRVIERPNSDYYNEAEVWARTSMHLGAAPTSPMGLMYYGEHKFDYQVIDGACLKDYDNDEYDGRL